MSTPFSNNVQKSWTAATATEVLLEYLWNAINVASAVGASEATLLQVLASLQNGSEFEARLVQDSDAVPVTWLEVRVWDTDSGTWGPINYYLPGSSVPGAPVLPVVYLDPNSILTTQLAELIALNLKFASVARTPSCIEVTAGVGGNTAAGLRSVSLFFRGTGGALNGVPVPNNFIANFSADAEDDTLNAIAFTRPTTGEARVIITQLT